MKTRLQKFGSVLLFLLTGSLTFLDSPKEVQARAINYPALTKKTVNANGQTTYITLCPSVIINGSCTL